MLLLTSAKSYFSFFFLLMLLLYEVCPVLSCNFMGVVIIIPAIRKNEQKGRNKKKLAIEKTPMANLARYGWLGEKGKNNFLFLS